jgi:cell division septation protein DedD
MLEERRQFPRLVPSTPLFVSMGDAKSGLLLDLCEGGLAVASLVPRNLNDVVSLVFDLPEGVGHIEAKAQVAWTRDSGHLTGVRFMDLDEVSQQQLCEWIAAGTNLRPAGSEDLDEPVIVTRSTYAQVDAIRRVVRPERLPELRMEPQPQLEDSKSEAVVEEMVKPAEIMAMDTVVEAPPEPETVVAAPPVEIGEIGISEPGETTALVEAVHPVETVAPSVEKTGTLFPEPVAEEERDFTAEAAGVVEIEEPDEIDEDGEMDREAFAIEEDSIAGTAEAAEPAEVAESAEPVEAEAGTPGSATRAEWVEHVAQMEDAPASVRFDSERQELPPDAETVGWASDAVGWVTEIAEKRVTAPEEVEFDGVFPAEPVMAGKAARPTKSRHTIELVLAVVLLTWALVFLGYQMGSTGANRTTHDVTAPKPGGVAGGATVTASANAKGDAGKIGNPSTASFASAESFPEVSPVPPITSGKSSVNYSNSASLEAPAPAAGRTVTVAPKGPATAAAPASAPVSVSHAPTNPTSETTILAGATPSMNSGLVLQVGAMKMEGNATALMQDLKKKKFSAFVYRHGNDSLYRVAVGPFGDRDSSAKVKSELEKNGFKAITAKWAKDKG